jgi:hypothetical protein
MSSSRRVLGTQASDGGDTSSALLDAEEEDLGEPLAILSGRKRIGSIAGWRRKRTGAKGGERQGGKKSSSGRLGSE